MKKYPKTPRYDHPVVNEDIFSHPNTILLEKFDGANCSFILYHSDFKEVYSSEIKRLNPDNNDLILFSKNNILGLESTTDKHVRGTYGNLIDYLTINIDKDELYDIYVENGVHQFFVEYMQEHTISEYSSGIPWVIGFDIYNISESKQHNNLTTPSNKYRESFIHFLSYEKVREWFNRLNLEVAQEIHFSFPFEPSEFEVPKSKYGDVKSEGVIIRNDTMQKRYKLRSEFFKEIQKKSKGIPVKEISSEEELLDTFCPEIRIRKMINKMISEDGYELSKSMNSDLYKRVNEDMWSEEYHEIMRIDADINPSKLNPLLAKRCIKVIEKVQNE